MQYKVIYKVKEDNFKKERIHIAEGENQGDAHLKALQQLKLEGWHHFRITKISEVK